MIKRSEIILYTSGILLIVGLFIIVSYRFSS